MTNFPSVIMAVAMVTALLLIAGGVKLALDRQTTGRGVLMIIAALGNGHERDDLDGMAGFTGSVASRMSR